MDMPSSFAAAAAASTTIKMQPRFLPLVPGSGEKRLSSADAASLLQESLLVAQELRQRVLQLEEEHRFLEDTRLAATHNTSGEREGEGAALRTSSTSNSSSASGHHERTQVAVVSPSTATTLEHHGLPSSGSAVSTADGDEGSSSLTLRRCLAAFATLEAGIPTIALPLLRDLYNAHAEALGALEAVSDALARDFAPPHSQHQEKTPPSTASDRAELVNAAINLVAAAVERITAARERALALGNYLEGTGQILAVSSSQKSVH